MKNLNIIEFKTVSKRLIERRKASGFVAFQFDSLKKKGLQVPVILCKV